ncbi:methyltransferase domain-containing protein [Roseimicrobium sp. ORNL1]|uniref:spermine/spermidine synthase domain-containing protein n=1 Tax=Roseimicrobium sp. ORNL1 TaxID=2711231 RepID=UPI0013E1EC7F|nr:methyltransferase domain-containing protein [Roseimicrobium sp. ORNL1]QIF02638.1 methyltransferase domain-containing protein [Roseimicrobium sp. ORNL1]
MSDTSTSTGRRLTLPQAWLLSAATGFLSLAWEIVWMRLYNFTTSSRALAFGLMLGAYLLGLAVGSLWSRKWQRMGTEGTEPLGTLATLISRATLAAFLVVPLVSWLVMLLWWPWTLLIVMGAAAALGTILPLICHLAIPPDARAGQRMAGVYLANIIGSGMGSLLTGFVLMEWLPLVWLCTLLLLGGFAIALSLRLRAGLSAQVYSTSAVLLLIVPAVALGYASLWERLHYRGDYTLGMQFAKTIESRHGVIHVDSNGTIYGNGAYDGSLETILKPDSWLVRPYYISALHPKPRRVLVIGVSGGAWTQILAHHPEVEEVIGVEISEPYLRLIHDSPSVASLHRNPKVKLVIDDGRRWLKRNPTERFDLIMMNTTHHWREFASALLSREFLELAKSHLSQGGIVAWNTTESLRSAKTGLVVFPESIMLMNFFVGSNTPLVADKARWRSLLERWRIDDVPVFDLTTEQGRADLEKCAAFPDYEGPWEQTHHWRWHNRAHVEARVGDVPIITDDNLGHEFDWQNW